MIESYEAFDAHALDAASSDAIVDDLASWIGLHDGMDGRDDGEIEIDREPFVSAALEACDFDA